MKTRLLKSLIYSLWFIFCLLVCVYLTFPEDSLTEAVTAQIELRLGKDHHIHVGNVKLAGLTGVTMNDLRLIPIREQEQVQEQEQEQEQEQVDDGECRPQPLFFPTIIDNATVTVGLNSLLRNDPEFTFHVDMGGGMVYGAWRRAPSNADHVYQLEISAINLNLYNLGMLSNYLQGALSGILRAHLTLHYDERQVLSGGSIDFIDIDNFQRACGPIELGPLQIFLNTPINLGHLHASAHFEGSDLIIDGFETTGGDLEIDQPSQGRFNLRRPFDSSHLRLTLELLIDEQWLADNDLEAAMRTIPVLRQVCERNHCAFSITGPVNQLQTTPLRARRN